MEIIVFLAQEENKELSEVYSVRNTVFVKGQGVPQDLEMDGKDDLCAHVLIKDNGIAAATARIRKVNESYKLERCAVLEEFRGKGYGEILIEKALSIIPKGAHVYLHAQMPVIGFYEKYGFVCVGNPFVEAGIQHCKMKLDVKGL